MTKQYRHFVIGGQVTDRVDSIDGGAFTETENNAAQAEVAATAGVALGDVSIVLGTTQPPAPQRVLTPDPVVESPPSLQERVDSLIETLSKSKTLGADDKAALEALKR